MKASCLSWTASILWLACSVVAQTGAADWPQFRGPGGLGVSGEKNLPVTWSDTDKVMWRTALPGYGASSPIVLGHRIYVTCYSGYGAEPNSEKMEDLLLHVVCINRSNGQILWNRTIPPKLPESERVRDHGYAGPTPTTDGDFLYVFFGRTGLFKFDLNGEQVWHADVGSQTHGWGCGTSPVLYKNTIIVNASVESGSLVSVNKVTGREVWRAPGMDSSWNTPHLVQLPGNKQELVVSVRDYILGFNPDTGEELWRCAGIQDYVCPSMISYQGIVYAIGGRQSRAIAVRAGGEGDVTETHRLWEAKAGANVSSPVIHAGHMYWVSDRNQVAYCVRLRDGEVIYSERFPSQPYASALAGENKIYIVTRYDGTYVLKAEPEFIQIAHNRLSDDSTFNASPVISNSQLFLRSDRFLYCIGQGG